MPKWTKSAYIVNSTKVTNGYYTATDWGHSYLMNEFGNSAYIWGVSYSNNSAYGTWRADR